jgi:predicted short-subunit dehydrogenase-like oxidoreductase (DUF2520 family)
MTGPAVAIVGAGRMGQGLALALIQLGRQVTLLGRGPRETLAPFCWPSAEWAASIHGSDMLLVATPDAAIGAAAASLLATGAVAPRHVVLHLSGLLDRTALAVLEPTGAALGSLHPLQTVADSRTAPERLRGAFAGIEGEDRALAAAESLASALGMRPVRIPSAGKADYHLGATFVANYAAALLALGQSFAERAGIPEPLAGELYRPLLGGAAENLMALGPADALTGAVRRGDIATIRTHLSRLEGRDRRLYCDLGMVALGLAREAGLAGDVADDVAALLRGATA